MSEIRRKFDEDFKIGAVRIVRESGKPIAQVARELGVNEGTLGNWCAKDRRARGEGGGALSEDERAVTVAGFIVAQRAIHRVPCATSCRALSVSQSWFYKWRDGDASPRHARREQLVIAIRQLFAAHHGRYGSPRITDDLRDAGWTVSEKTVAAIMREQRLVARPKRRRLSTTRQGRGRWRAPDLIGRDFPSATIFFFNDTATTEIYTDEGKLFLDSVLDMGSRRVVGFAMDEHHDTELAHAALAMAVAVRGGKEVIEGVIMHTDQGSA